MKTVAVFFGGKSSEHSIALASAKNIIANVDRDLYKVLAVGVDRQGVMRLYDPDAFCVGSQMSELELGQPLSPHLLIDPSKPRLVDEEGQVHEYDVAFPVFHGVYGEGGDIQGVFEVQGVDYVGPGLLSSALCMDKINFKRVCQQAGVAVVPYVAWDSRMHESPGWSTITEKLGQAVYVKPSRSGSSIGINKAESAEQYAAALEQALKEDSRVLVEQAINGRELECAVLGDLPPNLKVSGVGEVKSDTYYSFDEKYAGDSSAVTTASADIDEDTREKVRKLCVELGRLFAIAGLSRMDFFVGNNGQVFVNEINTIPGFTAISLYPRLWEESGTTQKQLVSELIESAGREEI